MLCALPPTGMTGGGVPMLGLLSSVGKGVYCPLISNTWECNTLKLGLHVGCSSQQLFITSYLQETQSSQCYKQVCAHVFVGASYNTLVYLEKYMSSWGNYVGVVAPPTWIKSQACHCYSSTIHLESGWAGLQPHPGAMWREEAKKLREVDLHWFRAVCRLR